MNPLWMIPIVWAIGLPIALAVRAAKTTPGNDENADATREKGKEGAEVRSAIWGAYSALKEQRAGGYGPWLSCCLSMTESIPCGVALQALRFTKRDLAGSRFRLDALDDAIRRIEEMEAGA